jgi:glycosyltransferase involved in cell wall biosynthesis
LPLLLEAWTDVARCTDANLVLLGPGPERQALMEMARQLGIAHRVHFAGAVSDPAEHLRAADIFVLPSVAEGMSNSLLEAMATGLPCVVSGIGGNADLITDGQTGRLIAEPSPQSWSSTLIELLENPAEASRLRVSARNRIEREFDLRVVVDRYAELYRRLIEGEMTN